MSKVNAFALNRTEIYDREIEGLTKRIDELTRAMRGTYSDGARRRHQQERDRLIADRVGLRQKRRAYVMRSTNPFERAWNFLRAHPWIALMLVFLSVMIPAGPQAIAGYAMIVGTIWFLAAAFRGIRRHYERRIDAKTGGVQTLIDVPGGVLEVRGQLSPEQAEAFKREWEAAARAGGASIIAVDGGTQFHPSGPVFTHEVESIPDRISAMHADDATDGVHPPLPVWMRTTWDAALEEYRTRVLAEGKKYWRIRFEYRELMHDRSTTDRDGMTGRLNGERVRETVRPDAVRLAERLDQISDEGAIYGERLVRSNEGQAAYSRMDAPELAIAEVGPPVMPRDFVPMLDRRFELTTDCRYHHVAEHALVETIEHPGYVVRTCTVCSPATFWIERA